MYLTVFGPPGWNYLFPRLSIIDPPASPNLQTPCLLRPRSLQTHQPKPPNQNKSLRRSVDDWFYWEILRWNPKSKNCFAKVETCFLESCCGESTWLFVFYTKFIRILKPKAVVSWNDAQTPLKWVIIPNGWLDTPISLGLSWPLTDRHLLCVQSHLLSQHCTIFLPLLYLDSFNLQQTSPTQGLELFFDPPPTISWPQSQKCATAPSVQSTPQCRGRHHVQGQVLWRASQRCQQFSWEYPKTRSEAGRLQVRPSGPVRKTSDQQIRSNFVSMLPKIFFLSRQPKT